MEDVNDFSKLVQCLDVIGLNRPAVHPSDVDPMKKFLYITLADFKYNNKIYQLRRETLEMICIIYGITPEKMKKDADNGIHYGYSTSAQQPIRSGFRQSTGFQILLRPCRLAAYPRLLLLREPS